MPPTRANGHQIHNGNLMDCLRLHAADTAEYAFEGNLGTAVDRETTFHNIANALDLCRQEDATTVRDYARFFLAAGTYAGGKATLSREFEQLIAQGCQLLRENNLKEFLDVLKRVIILLRSLDETYQG